MSFSVATKSESLQCTAPTVTPAASQSTVECERLLELRCNQLVDLIAVANIRMLEFEASAMLSLWDDGLKLLPQSLSHSRMVYEKTKVNYLGRALVNELRTEHYAKVAEVCAALTSLNKILHHLQLQRLAGSSGDFKPSNDIATWTLGTADRFDHRYFLLPKLKVYLACGDNLNVVPVF
jgi:hypothetical protein